MRCIKCFAHTIQMLSIVYQYSIIANPRMDQLCQISKLVSKGWSSCFQRPGMASFHSITCDPNQHVSLLANGVRCPILGLGNVKETFLIDPLLLIKQGDILFSRHHENDEVLLGPYPMYVWYQGQSNPKRHLMQAHIHHPTLKRNKTKTFLFNRLFVLCIETWELSTSRFHSSM